MDNKPIGTRYQNKYTVNNDGTITINGDTYIVHSSFSKVDKNGKNVKLQGIWISKFEPSSASNTEHEQSSGECYEPDLTGFDKNNTYIELYDKDNGVFKLSEEKNITNTDLKTVNQNKEWYDYRNRVWANIKTIANGAECWWVWIPRYAYKVTEAGEEVDTIFVDLNNKPYDKEEYGNYLPDAFTVHPCFTETDANGRKKELKGIWVSKYEPSNNNNANLNATNGDCLQPDMSGFDRDNTYIELYDESTQTFTSQVKLSEANLDTINNDKKWYDYRRKIWANVKTNANGLECWWVWIPRYAYSPSDAGEEMHVVFVGLDNKPIDKVTYGNELKEGMIVHPCFTKKDENGNTVQLSGIWVSKYEPSER